jgi:hypothetical protein
MSFEKSEIRFVISFFIHSQNVLGGLPVISFEKSQIRFVIQYFHAFPKIIKNYQFFKYLH